MTLTGGYPIRRSAASATAGFRERRSASYRGFFAERRLNPGHSNVWNSPMVNVGPKGDR